MKNKKIILIISAIILVIFITSLIYLLFFIVNKPQSDSLNENYYCKVARQRLMDNDFIDGVPCTVKSGSLSSKTNSVLVTFHLYTPSTWEYENYQMYEIDKNSEKIVESILPN